MREWKKYVSAKITLAKPMFKNEFDARYKNQEIDPTQPTAEGYAVQYRDGYISWCPKAEFELANREITDAELSMLSGEPGQVPAPCQKV
jgi:hypothetical protein